MTIYNAAPYLREAIDSIVSQTFQDWELIALENGSSDSSPAILEAYDDPRIRVLPFGKNIGRTPALRHAFDNARGEFIAVLDADDIAYPNRLERQVEWLDRDPSLGLIGTWAEQVDPAGAIVGAHHPRAVTTDLRDLLGWSNPFVHSSVMYRSALAREVGGYPANVTYSQDYALILKIAQRSRVGMIESVLCQLRISATRMTSDPSLQIVRAEESLRLLREAGKMAPTAAVVRLNKRRQAVARLKIGRALIGASQYAAGAKHIVMALITSPTALFDNGATRRYFGFAR